MRFLQGSAMSEVSSSRSEQSGPSRVTEARIDAPHVLGDQPPVKDRARAESREDAHESREERPALTLHAEDDVVTRDLALTSAVVLEESDEALDAWEQMRRQAYQLAGHLRARQADVDHRQGLLHSQLAEVERFQRGARLWFEERQHERQVRQQQLDQLSQQLAAQVRQRLAEREAERVEYLKREERLAALEQKLAAEAAELAEREAAVTERENSGDASFAEQTRQLQLLQQQTTQQQTNAQEVLRQALAGVERHRQSAQVQLAARGEELESKARSLAAREATLSAAQAALQKREELLTSGEADLAAAEQQLHAAQAEWAQERARQNIELEHRRQAFAQQQTQQQQQHAADQAELETKQRELQTHRASLTRWQAELRETQREALEMRLATEQLWAQLSAVASPAVLTQSLQKIRNRLADHYRLASSDLEDQKQQLELLRLRLDEQRTQLGTYKTELQQWVSRREQELEEQARQIHSREHSLVEREGHLAETQQRWKAERDQLQSEVRDLTARLRRHELASV